MAEDIAELVARLHRIRSAVADRGATEAANAMGRSFRRYVLKELNTGESAPGAPPARRSGALSDSVKVQEATGGGLRATSRCGPHIVYAAIQEHGGKISAKPGPARGIAHFHHALRDIGPHDAQWRHSLSWVDGSGRHFAMSVVLPARPYMRPAHDWAKAGGVKPAGKAAIDKIIDEA